VLVLPHVLPTAPEALDLLGLPLLLLLLVVVPPLLHLLGCVLGWWGQYYCCCQPTPHPQHRPAAAVGRGAWGVVGVGVAGGACVGGRHSGGAGLYCLGVPAKGQ
jgi:hypothetical protein